MPFFSGQGRKTGSYSRAEVAGLDLRRHVEAGRAGDLRGRRRRTPVGPPGRGLEPGGNAFGHEQVIGRVKLDEVLPDPVRVEGPQPRRILVRPARQLEHLGRAPTLSESRQRLGLRGRPVGAHRLLQRPIEPEQIDIRKGRGLVCDLMGVETARRGHRWSPLGGS
jgi:hypothetical protein